MLLTDFIAHALHELSSVYPQNEAKAIITLLCEDVIGTKNYTPIIEPHFEIPQNKIVALEEDVERLAACEPIQYILGKTFFAERTFKVSRSVLIPRQETELLCKEAVEFASRIKRMRSPFGKQAEPVRILDLCTGSGCIAWTLALSVPGCQVVGVDISEEALAVARSQGFDEELKSRSAVAPVFVKADVNADVVDLPYMKYDLILSNPPYIKESEKARMHDNVLKYEPETALFVSDEDPLVFYRSIAHWSRVLLNEQGIGLTEINETLGHQTVEVFKDEDFGEVSLIRDFFDKNRFVQYRK